MKSKYTTKQISRLIWQELKANKLQATNNTVAGLLIVGLEFLFVWLTKQTIDIATGSSNIFSFRTAIILIECRKCLLKSRNGLYVAAIGIREEYTMTIVGCQATHPRRCIFFHRRKCTHEIARCRLANNKENGMRTRQWMNAVSVQCLHTLLLIL